MRNLSDVLRNKAIDIKKLTQYGFAKEDEKYIFKKNILDNQFEVIVEAQKETMNSKLIDLLGEEEYVLVDVEDAQGEFVGKVRSVYEIVLNDIIEKCTNANIFN